ncbi:MAG: 3-dehydroquinate synthase [Planctomycetes bacterium]|nr:3-dehydroquinate synthase [Planctomycetota bacterium]
MQQSTTVHVELESRGYDILIGENLLRDCVPFLSARLRMTHVAAVVDVNVRSWFSELLESLREGGIRVSVHEVPSGEGAKSLVEAERLWSELLSAGTDRKSVLLAMGGGVTGDLAGFVAATFARGLEFVQVPTTLLSQVDSSVGGKVGINMPGAKNMIGVFWQPAGVLIDLRTLTSLSEREYRSGLAEVVKYGVILDADFFAWLEREQQAIRVRDRQVLQSLVARCCRLKADVVEKDERETTGLRAVLNYGHTFCHAIESVAGFGQYLHGEAVAIGMTMAAELARRMGRIDSALVARQTALLRVFGLPTTARALDHEQLIGAMRHDKKVEHGRLRFVLPSRLGHVELVDGVEDVRVREALAGGE